MSFFIPSVRRSDTHTHTHTQKKHDLTSESGFRGAEEIECRMCFIVVAFARISLAPSLPGNGLHGL